MPVLRLQKYWFVRKVTGELRFKGRKRRVMVLMTSVLADVVKRQYRRHTGRKNKREET